MKNPVTWFSIPSNDIDEATRFYEAAFDWKLLPETKEHNDTFNYKIALNSPSDKEFVADEKGRINGCIVKRETGIPHPVILIEVEDLDATAEKIKLAGGRVVSEHIPMPTLNGAFFLAQDPDNNVMEIFKSNN